ncbi:septum site-determining protein MinC [Alteromonas lipotrueiana]|uniref:septum site-determining protein MinC n=1 Tax=Alteromonas lipotrueiana TaxID=2803815 RepID=UPI001C481F56|nr:septum site-determining protein MinC [Alteromonas lipotrueiana]
MSQQCFRMKGTTLTSIVLDVLKFEPDEFEQQLATKIASAPQFFTRSSLILQINAAMSATEFELLVALCKKHQLQPMAVKGKVGALKATINDLGLSDISQSKSTDSQISPSEEGSTVTSTKESSESAEASGKPKIIDRPVRSGQQVYAQGGDLIIVAPVSEGAEILADGNIHVYGTMRGRALAGVKGDTQARIFCQQVEAELLSIAGRFVMQDTIQSQCWKQPAQAYLEDDTLVVSALV